MATLFSPLRSTKSRLRCSKKMSRRSERPVGETKDEFGFGNASAFSMPENENSLRIALNPVAREFLRWAFNDEPLLFGSLTFEVGTQQDAHVDSIFFYTQPHHAMAESGQRSRTSRSTQGRSFMFRAATNGALSAARMCGRQTRNWKRRKFRSNERRATLFNEPTEIAGTASKRWHQLLERKIEKERKSKKPLIIKKGDIVISARRAHPWGATSTKLRQLSRRSMVVHYIAKNAPMWDMYSFFLMRNKEFNLANALRFTINEHAMGPYIFHEKPVTY